jgi:DNA-binding CsgD family transcriptional regulator
MATGSDRLSDRALPAGPDGGAVAGPPLDSGRFQVSERVLGLTLALSLWVASGNLALAIIDGLGRHPLRHLLAGLVLVLGAGAALGKRTAFCVALRARPWLVVLVAAAQLGAVVIDGVPGSAYESVPATSIGLAAIAARSRTVWLCVAILELGYAAAVLAGTSPAMVVSAGHLPRVLGTLLVYPLAALVALGGTRLYLRFVASAADEIHRMRGGSPTLTPALARAIQIGEAPEVPLLPAPSAFADLTDREVRVVEALARGRRPKQIAFDWGIALATVRTHIRHAKRKTGARTLPELAAMTTALEWPASDTS